MGIATRFQVVPMRISFGGYPGSDEPDEIDAPIDEARDDAVDEADDEPEEEQPARRAPRPPVTVRGLTGAARRERRLDLGRERQARLRERQREAGVPIDVAVDRAIAYAVRKQRLDHEHGVGRAIMSEATRKLRDLGRRAAAMEGKTGSIYGDMEVARAVATRLFPGGRSAEAASGQNE